MVTIVLTSWLSWPSRLLITVRMRRADRAHLFFPATCKQLYLLFRDTNCLRLILTLKVLVATTDAQWEGMGDVGSARYEPALLPPCPTIWV